MVKYKNSSTKIVIKCQKHGEFVIFPLSLLRGRGCAKCSGNVRSNTEEFIKKARVIHRYLYDYSHVDYKNIETKVILICQIHGKFLISPYKHLNGQGCSKCKESRGEKSVRYFLEQYKISYSFQHRFTSCKRKKTLPFDFILYYRGGKYVVEFHGRQHYCLTKGMRNKVFSIEESHANFVDVRERDRIKREWCKKHKIPLLVIPYFKKDMIPQLISNFIGYDSAKIDFEQLEIE